jgi:L-malate glycosyltransferase
MSKKIKILHTENGYTYTGGARALLDYCVNQKKYIDSVVILPKGSKCTAIFKEAGIAVYEIPFMEIGKSIKKMFLYVPFLFYNSWNILKIAKKEKIDLLHSNDLYNMTFFVVKKFFLYNKPLITHIRLLPSSYLGFLYNLFKKIHLLSSDQLIGVSQAVMNAYGNPKKMEVIYDIGELSEKYAEYFFKYNNDTPFNYLYLANYIPGKGQDYAIKAIQSLGTKNSNITITFAGGNFDEDNEYLKKLKDMVLNSGLQDRIKFEGHVHDIEFKMKQYNAFLNFSESESFSFTCFDALRFGIPLVASDSGGPSELFINNSSGILVPNRDFIKMGAIIYKLSQNITHCAELSYNSKIHIKNIIKTNNGFNKLTKIILSLVETNK